ncbi:Glutamate synthase [NADPH] small chain [hydrothermal vent metagenome]|uniref:Glutamate synthase [NADPH] small chain n=1 Tax=hydrothermal vent metagenome TaxID=652676 RepID=A0A3B1BZ46_9ZZZZ
MGKKNGFRKYDRQTHGYQPVNERIKGFFEFLAPMSKKEVETQCTRCMDCGTPFCHPSCPLHNIVPDFNNHVYRGRWDEAYHSLSSTNSFPEFTGRVCPAPCESGCVLGLVNEPVTIKNIELSIIEHAFSEGWVNQSPPKTRSGKKVAVVGSGPAGLAVADQLNKAGHTVVVFERDDEIGGLLRYGIPDFKMEKVVMERRVDVMKGEGIEFRTGVNVGVDIPAKRLTDEYDAAILAGGSTIPRDLPIPGRNLSGVHFAMDYLVQSNRRVAGKDIPEDTKIWAEGKHVVVIGGGDTGSDCVGTAIRQNAASVTQIELLPKPPDKRTQETAWPKHPGPRMLSTSTSQDEGCEREWSILSKEFVDDGNGALAGVNYVHIDWEGNKFTEIEETGGHYKADLVFLAMGFLHPQREGMIDELGVKTDQRGNVVTDEKYRTSSENVFCAGDMRRGQSLVVWAISEGRECARDVDKFLRSGVTRVVSKNEPFSSMK